MKRKKRSRKTREAKSGPVDEVSKMLASTVMGLTPKQVIALNALVAGETKDKAAKAAKIHRNAIQYWMVHDRYFRTALQLAKVDLFGTLYEALRRGARRAIDVVVEIAENPECDTADRLSAAKFLLEKSFANDLTIGSPPIEEESIAFIPQTARCGGALAELDVIQAREELEAKFKSSELGKRAEATRQKIEQIQRQIANIPEGADTYENQLVFEGAETEFDGELSDLERLRSRVVEAVPLGRCWGNEQIQEFPARPSGADIERHKRGHSSKDEGKKGCPPPRHENEVDIALRHLNERCLIEQCQAENAMRRPISGVK